MSWRKQLPNWLTYLRIIAIPLVFLTFFIRGDMGYVLTASLFALASVTDWLDGYLARLWEAQSSIGRFLDPIADKLLVATCLLLLVSEHRAGLVPSIAIVCREILVSGLREFLAEIRVSVPVSRLAKWKTGVQMVAIFLLLLGPASPLGDVALLGDLLLWLAAALTLFTGYAYLKTGWKHMN